MTRYRIERDERGHAHRVRDPDGVEAWELSGKWSTKPGAKPRPAPRVTVTIRLPAEMVEWLRQQPEGITATIERLIKEKRP